MKRLNEYSKTFLSVVAVCTVLGCVLLAVGFSWSSPADALQANTVADSVHVEAFDHHVDDFGAFLEAEAGKAESREARTKLMEAQMRITCYETAPATLALAGIGATCDSLGVRR